MLLRQISHTKKQSEQGVVSLLTVIFFMVFISLITMGFIGIVVADQRQTIDNDLSASALAAARSGIEDGKRILQYCTFVNPSASGCEEALNSKDCSAFDSGRAHDLAVNTLAIPLDDKGEGATGGATQYQQYFTCLTIQTKTSSLSADIDAGGTDFIRQLKTESTFTALTVTWSGSTSGLALTSRLDGWPQFDTWTSLPVLQFQVIPYSVATLADPNGLDTIEAGTRTLYLAPCNTSSSCAESSVSINTDARSLGAGQVRVVDAPIAYAGCEVGSGTYTCKIELEGFNGGTPSAQQYYVRVGSLYAGTKLTLSASDSSGVVRFDNVQPQIDVTGRTNDVFRRVRAEVGYEPTITLPKHALSSAAPICKLMTVTNDASSSYDCD